MTRVLCSADHHFATGSRWDECLRTHQWMVDLVHDTKPDLFVSAGDIYDRASNPTEREAVAEWLQDIAKICPVVGVKGNHDRPLDVELLNRLRSKHPIHFTESTSVHTIAGICVVGMAWPETSWLAARTGVSGQELDQQARTLLCNVLNGLGAMLTRHDGPTLAVGHWMVDGSVASTGQPLLGMPLNVGLADLALLRAHAVVCGHIHRRAGNEWEIDGRPVFFPGSPYACNYGEVEDKSVTLLEWTGRRWQLDYAKSPSRPMLHLETDWYPEGVAAPGDVVRPAGFADYEHGDVTGAEVRLRYNVEAHHREEARITAEQERDRLLADGAHSVKLEPVVAVQQRARAPEVARATSLADQVQAYWDSISFDPGDRRESLLSKLAQLEEKNHV